jgi:glycosyltransferase involved in cell wall biosynthesis
MIIPDGADPKSQDPLRIGYITSADPRDRRSWSGIHFSIVSAVERNIGDVVPLGPVSMWLPFALGDRLNRWIVKPITGKRYQYNWSLFVSQWYAIIFTRRMKSYNFDLLLAPAGFTEIANLRTGVPIVYIADSTICQIIDSYPGLSGLTQVSKRELKYLESCALGRANLVCYSSEWAAESARSRYDVPNHKIEVIPFGANYPDPPARADALTHNAAADGICRLLLVGVEWTRKGADIAYDTMEALNRLGIRTQLTVVGCSPPDPSLFNSEHFISVPYLNMGKDDDRALLREHFGSADFFIMPSRAECAAIAFCDANAFGLPVLTSNVGGISSFVRDGINGCVLPASASGLDFAQLIRDILCDREYYERLRRQSRAEYEGRLNWDMWSLKLLEALQQRNLVRICKGKSRKNQSG